jgi:hypothetical protein
MIMNNVKKSLVKSGILDLRAHRLDSSHIFSNMAKLLRMGLFRKTVMTNLWSLKNNLKE